MSLVITKYYGQGNELVTSVDAHRIICTDKLVKLQITIQEKYINSSDKRYMKMLTLTVCYQ